MTTPETVLRDNDTTSGTDLYLSFELGDKRWTLTLSDARRGASRYTVSAGAQAEVLACIGKARRRCGLAASAPVHSCYEAGRDGWWLHRWLRAQGIDNIVVDSASIEVNRRARRAKTDRLDGDKLLAMLLRHPQASASGRCCMSRRLLTMRAACRSSSGFTRAVAHNRIGSLCAAQSRPQCIGGRDWAAWGALAPRCRRRWGRIERRARGWRWSSSRSGHWRLRDVRSWPLASSRWWRS
jgi:transposase